MTSRAMKYAGAFYPECSQVAKALAGDLVNQARESFGSPVAIVAPHAGWRYCGPVLGTAFRAAAKRNNVSRIVHLGPSHYHAVSGVIQDTANVYETPLGPIEIEQSQFAGLAADHAVHADEHALEVHLPIIRLLFPEARLLPLIVGPVSPSELAFILDDLGCGDDGTLTIVSSDLSHYLAKEDARKTDLSTLVSIEQQDTVALTVDKACGAAALSGLLNHAQNKEWKSVALDRRDSNDITRTDPGSVVGYGAVALYSPKNSITATLNHQH